MRAAAPGTPSHAIVTPPRHAVAMPRAQRGFVLIALIVLLTMGGLFALVSYLTPAAVDARRQQATEEALTQARDALLGYALQYRDKEPDKMYGYLPLPDLGSSRNNNTDPGCKHPTTGAFLEGCDAAYFNGINFDAGSGVGPTVIGRFPWRTLNTGPLRDGHGECLWLIVSASHGRIRKSPVAPNPPAMNGDTQGHLDLYVADGTLAMKNIIASAHDRPVAVIFAPGPPLAGQNRAPSAGDDVSACGGNYDAANYLDPVQLAALGGVANRFAGTPNNATATTTAETPAKLTLQGTLYKRSDGTQATSCSTPHASADAGCELLANDKGLALGSAQLFRALRKRAAFVDEMNGLLDGIEACLRADAAHLPDPDGTFSPTANWALGRVPNSASGCGAAMPQGYFSNFREQLFYARCEGGSACLPAIIDGEKRDCAALLMFTGERADHQQRATAEQRAQPANYLEGDNASSFPPSGMVPPRFSGPSRLNKAQAPSQDILRCIPDAARAAALTTADSPLLPADKQLASYDARARTLTLGSSATTGTGYGAAALFGCAWAAQTTDLGSGMRAYFRFAIPNTGDGFVFALADADRNFGTAALPTLPCGMSGQHLGYSGDNGITPYIDFPKIGVEIDTSRNAGYSASSNILTSGRNDPCYTTSCGGQGLAGNGHVGIVYWGYETANAAANANPRVTVPRGTDNIHGFPLTAHPSDRPAPQNPVALQPYPSLNPPDPPPGVAPFPSLTGGSVAGRDFHARIEITRDHDNDNVADAKARQGRYVVQMWILQHSATVANQIAAMKNVTRPMSQLYPGFKAKIADRATIHDLPVGTCSPERRCNGPERLRRGACNTDRSCPDAQACGADNQCYVRLNTCGSDNVCYQEALHAVRPGFTIGQRTNDQLIHITDYVTSWQP